MSTPPRSRRLRVQLGIVAALVIAVVLVAPVVLTGGGSGGRGDCAPGLRFDRQPYVHRTGGAETPTQKLAIGVGVLSGCGNPPTNVNVRSLLGVTTARAVGIDATSGIYVRRGVCASLTGARLDACLTTR